MSLILNKGGLGSSSRYTSARAPTTVYRSRLSSLRGEQECGGGWRRARVSKCAPRVITQVDRSQALFFKARAHMTLMLEGKEYMRRNIKVELQIIYIKDSSSICLTNFSINN